MGADLTLADGRALAVACLTASAAVTTVLGGPDRVYGGERPRPPYPMLRVGAAFNDNRDLRWLIDDAVVIEAWGDLDGWPGTAELRRVLYVALGALRDLPDRTILAGEPVVTDVRPGGANYVPGALGQSRYLATVALTIHPPA